MRQRKRWIWRPSHLREKKPFFLHKKGKELCDLQSPNGQNEGVKLMLAVLMAWLCGKSYL